MKRYIAPLALALTLSAGAFPAFAADPPPEPAAEKDRAKKPDEKKSESEKPAPELKPVSTSHEIHVDGKSLKYTAVAGSMPMKDEEGKLKANIFFIAYTRDGVTDAGHRPITFAYNGGPGSSSVWLHLGALGPKRVLLTDDGWAYPPPYRLVDNEESWLPFTDLVFIDPVTTGYSRPAAGEKPEQFHGLKEDVESVGDFIRLYTTRYQRWASPKFLAGESYGTTRSAGLSGYLQDRYGMYLSGITLISSVLNFATLEFGPGNDLPNVVFLPSYTAAAWYHKRLSAELQADRGKAIAESEEFAKGDYARALLLGSALPAPERARVIDELARLTGLTKEFIDHHDLRIRDEEFFRELLKSQNREIGRLDDRFVGLPEPEGREILGDPSYAAILGPYTAMFNSYIRGELKYESDLPYEILTPRVWPWKMPEGRYVDVAHTLAQAIKLNPALRVFIAAGYYDLATPFFGAEYTGDHLDLPAELRGNVSLDHFEAGHMLYIQKASRQRLTHDVEDFYRKALSE